MNASLVRLSVALFVAVAVARSAVAQPAAPHTPLAEQPLRMAKDIAAFEEQDRASPPPKHAVLLSGASSLRMWKDVAAALAPYPVINRGFGGSYTTEVLGYMDRITLPYEPRVVVFHCGGNDVNAGDPPAAPLGRIREYVRRLREKNPHTAVVFMATTRAPSRRAKWPQLDELNRGLAGYCREEKNVWFVDINTALNEPDGEGRAGHYLPDDLHPSEKGYAAIAAVLKPAVDSAWRATEGPFGPGAGR
jgi:lysophospholipase L1-like esterase